MKAESLQWLPRSIVNRCEWVIGERRLKGIIACVLCGDIELKKTSFCKVKMFSGRLGGMRTKSRMGDESI